MLDAVAYAAVLDGLERYKESEPIYISALSFFEKLYGAQHYEVSMILNNLAAQFTAPEMYSEAENTIGVRWRLMKNSLTPTVRRSP